MTENALKHRKGLNSKLSRGSILGLLFILPAFLYHLIIVTIPSCSTFVMSLYNWSGIGTGKFIGLGNFKELFHDPIFHEALFNNVKWMIIFLVFPIIFGLIVASVVSGIKKGQMVYRTIYFLPYVIATVVSAKIWSTIYNPFFGIGTIFSKLGLSFLNHGWLGDPNTALYAVAFTDMWHWWGFVMILFLGALSQVDPQLYEAARIDSANWWDTFIHVTLPGVTPTLVFIVMMTIIWSFSAFDFIYVMTGGGPGISTQVLTTYMYSEAFNGFRAGYANSIAVVIAFLTAIVYITFNRLQKKGWEI